MNSKPEASESKEDSSPHDRYLSPEEAAGILEISQEELWDLAHQHKIPTHSIAGAFLRFKREEVEAIKIKWRIERELFPQRQKFFSHSSRVIKATFFEKIQDFWYFNDFYIISTIIVMVFLYFILTSQ